MDINWLNFSTTRKFGVELEVSNTLGVDALVKAVRACGTKEKVIGTNGWASTDTNTGGWQVKTDSTCGPQGKTKVKELYGFEVASYVASGIPGLIDIANAATSLKSRGAEVNKHCGMHVHADARDLSHADVGLIIAQWIKIESTLFQACPLSRRNNKYCKPLLRKFRDKSLDKKYTPTEIWKIARPTNLGVHDNSEKKYALNTVGFAAGADGQYSGKHTLELRMPEGTLEKRDVKNWARMWIHFVSSAAKRTMPENLQPCNVYQTLQYLGLQGFGTDFYFLDARLYETKIWFLDRLCRYASCAKTKKEASKILAYIS